MIEMEGDGPPQQQQQQQHKGHALLLPYPAQGHYNPMIQFAKRLSSHGVATTIAVTRSILATTTLTPTPTTPPISIAAISDGYDSTGFAGAPSISAYLASLESVGSATLADVFNSRPDINILVYDAMLPWALDVGKGLGVVCVAFFTQSCAVDVICRHVKAGRLASPAVEAVSLPGLRATMEPADLPSFFVEPPAGPHQAYCDLVLGQYGNVESADAVLFNSFYELEAQEADWLASSVPLKTIGPTVLSSCTDNRLPADPSYGFSLFTPDPKSCTKWLDSKPPQSVVYVSFGSMAPLGTEQMVEVAWGLKASNKNYLWVVRASQSSNIPEECTEDGTDRGLIVTWSPQLEVLAHGAVGCFVTHCGWNSTMEAISLGVPTVTMPQWSDQATNAKYVEDIWGVGVRSKAEESGIVTREEIARCIEEVMGGERSEAIRKNSDKWKEAANAAVSEGGSSDKNIAELIDRFVSWDKNIVELADSSDKNIVQLIDTFVK